MLRVGLIGYGYWGPNLARNFSANPDCQLVRIADMSEARRTLAANTYPGVEVVPNDTISQADDLDVVVIATPVFTHYDLAKAALENGKHVWLEKPMTSNSAQGKELTELADSQGLVLLVDHTGEVIARTGYMRGGPAAYVKHLKELLGDDKEDG